MPEVVVDAVRLKVVMEGSDAATEVDRGAVVVKYLGLNVWRNNFLKVGC